MKTGNGKVANLPPQIRNELNFRISDGDQGNELVEWLNSKPEVADVVNKLFDGTPISEQNLSEWRKRGYQKWLAHRNFVDESNALSDNTADIAGIDCDKLLLTLTAAYAEAIQNWIITPGEQMLYKLAVYKNLTNGVLALQRAELQKVRLEIARERLELLREKRRNKSPSSEAIGRGAGVGAGGCPGKGGGPGKSRATGPSAALAESAQGSHQNDSECRSRDCGIIEPFRRAQGPEPAEGLRHSSASAEADSQRQGSPATEESTPKVQSPGAAPASHPAIDYEFWRGLLSPSFAGVPRGGPWRQKPDDVGAASKSAALPETGP